MDTSQNREQTQSIKNKLRLLRCRCLRQILTASSLIIEDSGWSGLAALQQGTIALALSDGDVWQDAFDNSDQANAYGDAFERDDRRRRGLAGGAW